MAYVHSHDDGTTKGYNNFGNASMNFVQENAGTSGKSKPPEKKMGFLDLNQGPFEKAPLEYAHK
jgi:hypothetical protein